MSARWRDKKGEPGFVFHAWMRTVDELEDQIEELVAALLEARIWVQGAHDQVKGFPIPSQPSKDTLSKIDAALAKAEAQS